MNRWSIVSVATALILAGCGSSSNGKRKCANDIDVGEVQAFGDETPSTTEGITFDAMGNLFASAQEDEDDDQLLQFMPDGTFEAVASAESILGLASHPSGIIAAGIATGDLLLIDPATGMTEVIAPDLGFPNFVVVTPWNTILVSDDTFLTATITEVTFDGDVSEWLTGVPTPNGMVFSLDQETLYVVSTFEDEGLWTVPVSPDGQAGPPDKLADFDVGSTPDGVAIDSEGNVYVALNLVGEIAKVSPDGNVTTLARNVSSAASLAFGQGEYDPCSIYVTSLFGLQILRVGTGVLGPEQ